jgi:lipopolysaccharide export system protein LptC
VRAQGLVYDAAAMIWTFERSVVTLPATPGQDDNAAADPEIDP